MFLKFRNSESQNLRISEVIREILEIRGGFYGFVEIKKVPELVEGTF